MNVSAAAAPAVNGPEPAAGDPDRTGTRAAGTRERILEAGVRCVRRWGLRRVSMNDVAHEAGLARRTVYAHFPDREALVLAVLVRNARQGLEAAGAKVRRRRTLATQVGELAVQVLEMPSDERSLGLGYRPGEGSDATLRLSRVDEVADEWIAFWEPFVEAARARGEVREDVDVRAASEWITRVIVSLAVLPPRPGEDPGRVGRSIGRYAVGGLAP